MFITQGGGVVGGAQITDGSISTADFSAATIATFARAISAASTTTLAVSPNGSQVLTVWAKGRIRLNNTSSCTVSLKYNGVAKDTFNYVTSNNGGDDEYENFSLLYTETPSAGAQNITVDTTAGVLAEVKIMVLTLG